MFDRPKSEQDSAYEKMMSEDRKRQADELKELAFRSSANDFLKAYPSNMPTAEVFDDPNWTSNIFKHVRNWIERFQEKLDPQHEVGARLVNFGQSIQFYLETIEYCESPLMLFKGSMEDGTPVELIQHVSQISILLVRLPKQNPDAPKRTIGFHEDGA